MSQNQVEVVLRNWIDRALNEPGIYAEGVTPESWIASNFYTWWQLQVANSLGDAERSVDSIVDALNKQGGWSRPELGDALHEATHATEALNELRQLLGLSEESP